MVLSSPVPAHSITALCYRFCSGPVDLAPLVIRQAKRFDWQHSRVTAYVLGASHALNVALPDGREFTELLTCLPPRFPQKAVVGNGDDAWLVPETYTTATQDISGLNWVGGRVRLSRFLLLPGANELSGAFAPENTLHEPFPLPSGQTAWTRIGWCVEGSQLRVETIHTYPGDEAGIRSETCLRLFESELRNGLPNDHKNDD